MIAIVISTKPRRRGRPRDPKIDAMAASMARDYRRGLTIREVAAKHRVSYGATRQRLLDREVQLRGIGGRPRVVEQQGSRQDAGSEVGQ